MSLPLGAIRDRLADPRRVAELLGLEKSRAERGKWRCPRHGGASLSLRVGPDGALQARCFGCDLAGDVFSLVAEVHGLDNFRDVAKRAAELAGVYADDTAPRSAPPRRAPSPPSYPDDGPAFWDGLARLERDRALRTYLAGRGFDPADVQSHGLARVLLSGAACPPWAACGAPWSLSGHRLIVPVYDARGELRSVRAWRSTGEQPKRVAPRGYSTAGLVLADLFGLAMLRGEAAPSRVLVVEGEPDFMTAALAYSLVEPERPAVLGVVAGSWTDDLAARVPRGARVTIATDRDAAGERYAEQVARSLSRRCAVTRARPAA